MIDIWANTYRTFQAARMLGIDVHRFDDLVAAEGIKRFANVWEGHEVKAIALRMAAYGTPVEKASARALLVKDAKADPEEQLGRQ